MGLGILEDVQEEEASVDEMRKSLFLLKQKLKKQTRQILAWKNKFNDESRAVAKLKDEKQEYLQAIQSQLLVFESHLKKTKNELESVVQHKDNTIHKQHQLICAMSLALLKRDGQKELQQILPGLSLNKNGYSETYENNEIESNNNMKNNNHVLNNEEKKKTIIISSKTDFESLNDSDSAIMMEDAYDSLVALPSEKGEAKVMRSVSDALEIISRGVSLSLSNKVNYITQIKHGHGSLSSTPSCSSEDSDNSPPSTINKLRNEILREEYNWNENSIHHSNSPITSSTPCTYYSTSNTNHNNCGRNNSIKSNDSFNKNLYKSISNANCSPTYITAVVSPVVLPPDHLAFNESHNKNHFDIDSDATLSDGHSDDGDSGFGSRLPHPSREFLPNKKSLFGSYEKLNRLEASYIKKSCKEEIQVTYNRVMSNHRSVTKPKDVKYKRINKAKSRSLEELRGKLKLFDGKQAFTIDVGVSDA